MNSSTDQVGLRFQQQSDAPLGNIENAPIVVNLSFNGAARFSAGDGTIDIELIYRIATIP